MTRATGPLAPVWMFAAAVALPLAALAAALVSQHAFDMQPCPWCVLQRAIFAAIALAALPGLLVRAAAVRRASAAAFGLLAACGVAAALWQHLVAASSTSCTLTLADRIVSGLRLDSLAPEVFAAYASCADAAATLFGLPYEFYSLALYAVLAGAAAALLRRPSEAGR